ncbi:TPM domain-containing protein [Macrococcus animalis]|uniref:TPM domain-containing protein n=1 Tax=Macrococcus animalis TaxID=3395467 RepID=UPI0039BDF5F1
MKKIILFVLFCFWIMPQEALAIDQPLPKLNQEHIFIQDYAQLLGDSEIKRLNDLGEDLEKQTGIELLLVTMNEVEEPRRDYALRLLREHGVGKKEYNNGIVMFLNLDKKNNHYDRGVEIQIGYGLEGYFNDARVGEIIDKNGLEALKKEQYATGLKTLYTTMYDESFIANKKIDKKEVSEDLMHIKAGEPIPVKITLSLVLGYVASIGLFGILWPLIGAFALYSAIKSRREYIDYSQYPSVQGRITSTHTRNVKHSSGSKNRGSSTSRSKTSDSKRSFGGGSGGGGGAGRGF